MELQGKVFLNLIIKVILICEETIMKIKDKKTLRIYEFLIMYM